MSGKCKHLSETLLKLAKFRNSLKPWEVIQHSPFYFHQICRGGNGRKKLVQGPGNFLVSYKHSIA